MMNLNNENILNIDELKKIYLKERLSVKKNFFQIILELKIVNRIRI